jgi:hypothetical protein
MGLTIPKTLAMAGLNMETYTNSGGDSFREFLSQSIQTETLKRLEKSTI